MKINEAFNEKVVTAIQLFSSGWCNLECKYCYIPKTDFLKTVHKKIIERVKDGSLIKELKEMVGDELDSLSHWGTEPSLTLPFFKDFYKEAGESFPNLNNISMSSNFMTLPNNIIEFVNNTLPKKKKLNVSLQISLDGPPWITDDNRTGGSTEKIVNNVAEVLKNIEDYHNVSFHIKATITKEIIQKMNDPAILEDYYNFFESCFEKWNSAKGDKKIFLGPSVDPTVVSPDSYTKQDGINFFNLINLQFELGMKGKYKYITQPLCFYFKRWIDKIPYYKEFYTKPRMFSCSSGDSCLGFGDKPYTVYGCHRAYYTNYPEYIESIQKWNTERKMVESTDPDRNKIMTDTNVANVNDKKKFLKTLYVNRGFQDFMIHRNNIRIASIVESAHCGQISPIYKKVNYAYLLSLFLETNNCQIRNINDSGLMESQDLHQVRLFANGAVELYLRKFLGRE